MALSQTVSFFTTLVFCQFYAQATSQLCLYNYTIGTALPVIVTQSDRVCLICSNTAFTQWGISGVGNPSGIPETPYVLNVTSPTVTFFSGPQVACSDGSSGVSSMVYIAAPVVPQVVTYVNETETLSVSCSNVATVTSTALALFGTVRMWLDPNGNAISNSLTFSLSSVNRTATGIYTCVTRLNTLNVNGLANVTGTTLVVVYYPPTVLSPQPIVYMAQGRSIQLNCTFDGLPPPDVTWTSPNGSVITNGSRFTIHTTSTSSSLTITSLVGGGGGDNGTYTCSASNFRGVHSNMVHLFVQVSPDPPSNLMMTGVSNSSISLSWTTGFNGYSPFSNVIISYEVDSYPEDGTRVQTFPMGTSATLVGLHPYSNYTIHVTLSNVVGFTSNPTNITATTRSLRPMAPTIISVVAVSSTEMTITWMSPFINSSTTAPVISWTVMYSCYSPWNPSNCPSGSMTSIPSSSSSYSIARLMKGSNYTFTVFGNNSGGDGDVSSPATNQTLVDPPLAVLALTYSIMTTTSVRLTWTPPMDNGGQNIRDYIIKYGRDLNNLINTTTMATQILLSELTQNSYYLFFVSAHNGFAAGMASQTGVLLVGYPIKPASVQASGITDTYVTITWQLETPPGFIDYFILSYRPESSETWTMIATSLSNGTRTYMLTRLNPNTSYVVGVATMNPLPTPSNYTIVTFTTASIPSVSSTSTTSVTTGTSFTLTCNIGTGNTTLVVWSKDGSSLPSSAMASGNTLVFTNPQPADSGSYTCGFLGSTGPSSQAFMVSIKDSDMTTIIIIVVVVGGVSLLVLILAISVVVCYCCFCRNPSSSGHSKSKAAKNSKWTAPIDTSKPKTSTIDEPSPSRPHLTSFHTPAKPAGTLMQGGAIRDDLPESYSGASTFGTALNKQPSQPNPGVPQFREEPEQMQYAALSFGGGAPRGGEAKQKSKSNLDDMVTYAAVETKGNVQLLPNEERNTSASPDAAAVTSMV